MKKNVINSIAVIGLGLMGGSLGFAVKRGKKNVRVFGVSRSARKVTAAVRRKIIDDGDTNIRSVCKRFAPDLFVVATPVNVIRKTIREIDAYADKKVYVTDVGSTKKALVSWAEKQHFKHVVFVGSHPMAGSHEQGLRAATKDLYAGSHCFLTRTAKTNKRALVLIDNFWQGIRVRTTRIDPSRHDAIVAAISHMPHAVAAAVVSTVLQHTPGALAYASRGFLDSTRIAQSDPGLWVDVFMSNRTQVMRSLEQLKKMLTVFTVAIQKNDSAALEKLLTKASRQRTKLHATNQ